MAVEIPMALSPSRASDFTTCPLLFRFRTIDRFPEEPSEAAVRGTLVHAVLERLFDVAAVERTPTTARSMIEPAWADLREREPEVAQVASDEEVFLGAAASLVERYFRLEDPQRLEPARREVHVRTELESGLVLRGYIDRVDVAPDGRIRIVDYKTGKAPPEGFAQKPFFQMRFYGLALWRAEGVVPTELKLLYLGNGESLAERPSEDELLATERKVLALWRAVEESVERRDFRPRPSRLCDWCDHRSRCPEFDGVLPELPELRIVPANDRPDPDPDPSDAPVVDPLEDA